ncbi:MAG: DUF4835 family protein [Bacteroidia bacterium]
MMTFVKSLIITLCLFVLGQDMLAQPVFCQISVNYAQAAQSDRQIYQDMQRDFSEYMNFQAWSDDKFEQVERIRARMNIVIQSRPSADRFRAQANIVVYRPVWGSTYESVVANISDKFFEFNYVQGQPLQFNESGYVDQITSLMNFYGYLITGIDYATFSPNAGRPFFKKAQEIVEWAQTNQEDQGWTARGLNNFNRYWLAENLNNSNLRDYQNVLYKYHRQGLDQMAENLPKARRAILECCRDMQRLNRSKPLLYITRVFLDTKRTELIGIFKNAFVNDQKAFIEIMTDLDPRNAAKYQEVSGG